MIWYAEFLMITWREAESSILPTEILNDHIPDTFYLHKNQKHSDKTVEDKICGKVLNMTRRHPSQNWNSSISWLQ